MYEVMGIKVKALLKFLIFKLKIIKTEISKISNFPTVRTLPFGQFD